MRGIPEPPKRKLPGFSKRFITRMFACILVMLIGFGILYGHQPFKDPNFNIGFGLIVFGVVLAVAINLYMFSHVRCPECSRPNLPRWKPNDVPGAPFHYYCGKCHVVWDTEIRHADESDAADVD